MNNLEIDKEKERDLFSIIHIRCYLRMYSTLHFFPSASCIMCSNNVHRETSVPLLLFHRFATK